MSNQLRWGIVGTGNIARQFTEGVVQSRRGSVVAVGSRSVESAGAFAERFGLACSVGDYAAVVSHADVDAVYVALPNNLHHEWTVRALQAGKHVLCEKPMSGDVASVEAMFDEADRQDRVLIEAFMYRTHPLLQSMKQQIRDGAIGEVKLIRTSFCFRTGNTTKESNVRFDPDLIGGGLMDIGCYCLDFGQFITGESPTEVQAFGHVHQSGVDDVVVGTAKYPGGVLLHFSCGMTVQADNAAHICGDEGYIEVPVPWKPPVTGAQYSIKQQLSRPKQDTTAKQEDVSAGPATITMDSPGHLYGEEADRFADVVLDGAEPFMTREESIANIRALESLRRQIGLSF